MVFSTLALINRLCSFPSLYVTSVSKEFPFKIRRGAVHTISSMIMIKTQMLVFLWNHFRDNHISFYSCSFFLLNIGMYDDSTLRLHVDITVSQKGKLIVLDKSV